MRIFKRIFIVVLLILLPLVCSCSKKDGTDFNFASYKTAEKVPYKIFFLDEYFNEKASIYNPHLASASICLALAGFSAETRQDFENSAVNSKELFTNLGFSDFLSNKDGISRPNADSFGVYIARKKIRDYTLLGITVRGAGYLSEWSSNFKIGTNDKFAQGFYEASEIYLNHLKSYIETFNVEGHIKIWTAGFSRGGASVNIACGRICDGLKNNENIISSKVSYDKDDIYAYSFEAPRGKVASVSGNEIIEKGNDYSNIHNVLNLNDVVPFVAPYAYSFVRYGTDLFLPDIITDLNYETQIKTVKKRIKSLPNYTVIGDYSLDKFSDTSKFSILNFKSKYVNFSAYPFLSDFVDRLCEGIGTRSDYVDKIEPAIRDIFELLYEKLSPRESLINFGISIGKNILLYDMNEVLLFDLQHNRERFIKDLDPILTAAFRLMNKEINVKELTTLVKTMLESVLNILSTKGGFDLIRPLLNFDNLKAIGGAHLPELALSHVTALDSYYNNSNLTLKSSFNKLIIKTSNKFELLINNERYVYFNDNEILSKLVLKHEDDTYIIYLPSDVEFSINSFNNELEYELYNHNNKYLNEVLIRRG